MAETKVSDQTLHRHPRRSRHDYDLSHYPFQIVWNRQNITPALLDRADKENEAVLHEIGYANGQPE